MKVTPRSEAEIQQENPFAPWPAGIYDFEVMEAEESLSTAGNEMIKLTISVYNRNGDRRVVFDYLLDAVANKVKHAAEACGAAKEYASGNLQPGDFLGKTGKLKLAIQPEKNGYPAKNNIRDYVTGSSRDDRQQDAFFDRSPPASRDKAPAGGLDDEIPF